MSLTFSYSPMRSTANIHMAFNKSQLSPMKTHFWHYANGINQDAIIIKMDGPDVNQETFIVVTAGM